MTNSESKTEICEGLLDIEGSLETLSQRNLLQMRGAFGEAFGAETASHMACTDNTDVQCA